MELEPFEEIMIEVTLGKPHHMRSTVKCLLVVACSYMYAFMLVASPIWLSAN